MKYSVTVIFDASVSVEVEAESADQAIELAMEHERMCPGLCHQCADEIELGDAMRAIVYDDKGEVLDQQV